MDSLRVLFDVILCHHLFDVDYYNALFSSTEKMNNQKGRTPGILNATQCPLSDPPRRIHIKKRQYNNTLFPIPPTPHSPLIYSALANSGPQKASLSFSYPSLANFLLFALLSSSASPCTASLFCA